MIAWVTKLFLLLCGHAIADFALQTEWIAKHKNRHNKSTPPTGQKQQSVWAYVLTAHSLIHGLMVYLVTSRTDIALAETAIHWITDFGKCENWYGIHADQCVHISCKILWSFL